jgi:hypothetical protein
LGFAALLDLDFRPLYCTFIRVLVLARITVFFNFLSRTLRAARTTDSR